MERKKVIDMSLEEMAEYTPEEISRMMDEDYEEEVKRMDQEYQASVNRMREKYQASVNQMKEEYQASVNRMKEENREDLPCIRFDLAQAKEIIKIIRKTIRKNEDSGLIDYKYLPDKNRDRLEDNLVPDNTTIGGFCIVDMYGNLKHMVTLYSNGSVAYRHEIPDHAGIGSKYRPDLVYSGWYFNRWEIPADEVWALIPKLDPK